MCSVAATANADLNLKILGKGGNKICVVKDTTFTSLENYIARDQTELDASAAASNQCVANATFATNCSQPVCDTDNANTAIVNFDIGMVISGKIINLSFNNAHLGSECLVKNTQFDDLREYVAKAPTQLEAQAVAENACLADATFKNNCQVQTCEAINEGQAVQGSIDNRNGGIHINAGTVRGMIQGFINSKK